MRATSGRAEQALHFPQSFSNSCQPACIATARARRATEAASAIEARLHIGAAPKGHDANERKWLSEPGTSLLKSTVSAAELAALRSALSRGAWVMVHVFGPRWVARLPRGVTSPHGSLCQPADAAFPLHAVLLVAADAASFFVLDPFHTGDLQPFEISDTELLAVLSGFSSLVIEP